MRDISKLTASTILAIPITAPEKLYTGDPDVARQEWQKLSKQWHPDRKGDKTGKVMAQINALYQMAVSKLNLGIWVNEGTVRITTKSDQIYEIKFRRRHEFELGEMYVGDKTVVFAITEDGYDLADDALARIKGFKYANDAMKLEFARYLPVIKAQNETVDRRIIVLNKTPDQLLLRDVLDHFKGDSGFPGKIDPKHVAWILSRLYNLFCYLRYSNVSHNDISPDTVFISPEHHSAALLGGWWYAGGVGERLKAVPSRTLMYAPMDLTDKKRGDATIDSELIRATGRELLGDITGGGRLSADPDVPRPLLNWLRGTGTSNAVEEYQTWQKQVLIDSFGQRHFTELKLTAEEIYT